MRFNKILTALVCGLVFLTLGQVSQVHAWFVVKPYIEVTVNDPTQILYVDLLIPLEEAPILLDEENQPIDHPLNGYLTPDGYGSASLYSTFFELLEREKDDVWTYQSETKNQTPFYIVVIETSNERYLSNRYSSMSDVSFVRWVDGVYSFRDFTLTLDFEESNPSIFYNVFPYIVLLLIALLDFPLLFYTGYRKKNILLLGGLIHFGIIAFLAVLNRVYHLNNNLTYFLILIVTLSLFTVGEAVFFALYFRERSTIRAISVSMFGMFASSFLMFYYMSLGVF